MQTEAHFWHADKERCIQDAIQAYIDEGRQPATIRHYYYKLLSSGALKPISGYENSKDRAYKWVSRLLTEARDDGTFPWYAVVDTGRRSKTYYWHDNLAEYVASEARSGFRLDLWRGQGERVEIIVEKDGLVNMVGRYVERWRIPVRALDGFNSTTRNKELANRYGTGRNYTLLTIGDYDPSGLLIPATLKARLKQYGCYPDIRRIALVKADTERLPAHASIEVDSANPHAKACKWEPGQPGYEIEALTPTQLEQRVLESISPYLDNAAYRAAIELEQAVKSQVATLLKQALQGFTTQAYQTGIPGSTLTRMEQLRYLLDPDDYQTLVTTGSVNPTSYE